MFVITMFKYLSTNLKSLISESSHHLFIRVWVLKIQGVILFTALRNTEPI